MVDGLLVWLRGLSMDAVNFEHSMTFFGQLLLRQESDPQVRRIVYTAMCMTGREQDLIR